MAKKKMEPVAENSDDLRVETNKQQAKKDVACTKEEFFEYAEALPIKFADFMIAAAPKEFKTLSYGWYASGKATIEIAEGVYVPVQVSMSFTVIGSKPVPETHSRR